MIHFLRILAGIFTLAIIISVIWILSTGYSLLDRLIFGDNNHPYLLVIGLVISGIYCIGWLVIGGGESRR